MIFVKEMKQKHPWWVWRVLLAVACLTGICGSASAQNPPADLPCPKLSRGINIHHMLNWPDTKPGDGKTQYVWPPFEAANYQMSDAEIEHLKAMGFDFVRVTADPSIFLTADKARFEYLTQLVQKTSRRFISAGLNVVFDLHPVDVNPDYAPLKLVASIESPEFRAYSDLVEKMARSLNSLPHDHFAFELMNEPWLEGSDIPRWQSMMERLHIRARKGSADLPLVITGAAWSDAKALMQLDLRPFKGSNVLYTFHYYDPHTYTHQGVSSDEGAYLSGLRWPASHDNIQAVLTTALARISAVQPSSVTLMKQRKEITTKLLHDYELTAHNRDRLHADFTKVANWAARERIPTARVYLGEFGCVNSANGVTLDNDRVDWLRAMRNTAQEFGFPWALWAYKGYGGMALFGDSGIDEGIAAALELHR